MFTFTELDLPLVAAPMAGGPSAPALVTAVAATGGAGFLAAGYKTPAALETQIHELRKNRVSAFGVNLFVPGDPVSKSEAVAAYREELRTDGSCQSQ